MNTAHFEALYPANARFTEIEKIFQYIKEGHSCQLIGLPGVGRANVLNLLAYNRAVREIHVGENQKWFHFVTVDFSEVRGKPLFETTKLMFLELVESLHERQLEDAYEVTTAMFKEALGFQDELVLFQGLKKVIDYLAIEKELTIIFLFDRFEEYIPMLTTDFFSNLRVLRNKAKYRFSVIFSLGRPLEDMVEPTLLADYYEFFTGHAVYLPLGDKPITDFRIGYLEKVSEKTIAKTIVASILVLTGGHGKLTRLCVEAAVQSKETVSEAFFLSRKPIHGALLEIWYYLTPEEQQDIVDLIKKKTPIQTLFLEDIGIVEKTTISIPLFSSFVEEEYKHLIDEKIVFDDVTNTIRQGAKNISDMLTISEFRLFAFLLQHEEEIIQRSDLIDAVWKNGASTAGVTDQALDQLLFRLRKKIEENPNQPEHILTVKGRGVKYQG